MEKTNLPKATLGRLPQYIHFLKSLPENEFLNISATTIAKGLALGDVQVRKDLALISGTGKPKIGYIRKNLIDDIEDALGCDRLTPAVLVGAGRLGKALFEYNGFKEYGIDIIAAFDCSESVLKNAECSKKIHSIDELNVYCKENNVKIGIITVGVGTAQDVCDEMVSCGIEAIWNFAPCRLEVPQNIIVKQENLALSLAHLNSQLCK